MRVLEWPYTAGEGGGGVTPPGPPPTQDQRDHRGKKRILQQENPRRAFFGTAQTPPPFAILPWPLHVRYGGAPQPASVGAAFVLLPDGTSAVFPRLALPLEDSVPRVCVRACGDLRGMAHGVRRPTAIDIRVGSLTVVGNGIRIWCGRRADVPLPTPSSPVGGSCGEAREATGTGPLGCHANAPPAPPATHAGANEPQSGPAGAVRCRDH